VKIGAFIESPPNMKNPYLQKFGFINAQISEAPIAGTSLFVVIPCFDEPNLIATLSSINDCIKPNSHVEIITVINASENDDACVKTRNSETLVDAKKWAAENKKAGFTFHFIDQQKLPKKHAGVGLARKIGMDEAVYRMDLLKLDDAPIICFDADSKCDSNYLVEIEQAFLKNPKAKGASIYFEHPIYGVEFQPSIYNSIIDYELHLRYYKNALEYTGHPMACFTIGSSMAVMSSAYQSQGGMNKRKAGEDFYFMQKIVERYPIIEINTSRVIPSPRPSHRVPFGTGRAISEFQEGKNSNETYAFKSFEDQKLFLEVLPEFYKKNELSKLKDDSSVPKSIRAFLQDQNFEERIPDLLEYGKTWETFQKRFFNWFNAFRALKFVHFARDHFYANQPLKGEVEKLFDTSKLAAGAVSSNAEFLRLIREHDKNHD